MDCIAVKLVHFNNLMMLQFTNLCLGLKGSYADGMTVAAAVNMHPELFGVVCLADAWLDLLAPKPPVYMDDAEVSHAIGNTQVHFSLCFSHCTDKSNMF